MNLVQGYCPTATAFNIPWVLAMIATLTRWPTVKLELNKRMRTRSSPERHPLPDTFTRRSSGMDQSYFWQLAPVGRQELPPPSGMNPDLR